MTEEPEFVHKPCCFCGQKIRKVKNGYTVVWGGDDEPEFCHDGCIPAEGTKPMSGPEIAEAMAPSVHAAFATLKKIFTEH